MAEREVEDARADGRGYALYVVGKKAQTYFRFKGYEMEEVFLGVTDQPTYEQAREIGAALRPKFEAGEYYAVDIAYWRFLSAGTQTPVLRRFLPLKVEEAVESTGPTADLEYEPSPSGILTELLPRYVDARIYSALLDASASEHAARQRAMKAATDNAEELKTNLTRIMNRARQDSITTEIMEIVGGAEALSQDKGSKGELIPSLLFPEHMFPRHLDPLDHDSYDYDLAASD
jgi:F-type H+-transporting ATPase subunit gamma